MYTFTVIIHILASLALILIVLLQTGRGAEMGAAFGGASQTLFGGSGSSGFLGKLTTAAAVIFMITCLGLTKFSGAPQTRSIMENVPIEKQQGPVLPEAKPVQPAPEQSGAGEAAPEAKAPQAQAPATQDKASESAPKQ